MKETTLKEGIERNNIDSMPFRSKYLDEEKEETGNEILTIRFNSNNREMLDIIKWYFHEPKDATAIKYAIEWMKNDIQHHLSESSWRKICSETRRKPEMKQPKILQKD
jgi:hypothetical protein